MATPVHPVQHGHRAEPVNQRDGAHPVERGLWGEIFVGCAIAAMFAGLVKMAFDYDAYLDKQSRPKEIESAAALNSFIQTPKHNSDSLSVVIYARAEDRLPLHELDRVYDSVGGRANVTIATYNPDKPMNGFALPEQWNVFSRNYPLIAFYNNGHEVYRNEHQMNGNQLANEITLVHRQIADARREREWQEHTRLERLERVNQAH